MPETEHSQENLAYIRTHVDNIERMAWFQLASSPNRTAFVTEQFKAKKNSAKVYLSLETEQKTQDALIKKLKMSRANLSKILSYLEELHFIGKHRNPEDAKKLLFGWTEAERILGLSKVARELTK